MEFKAKKVDIVWQYETLDGEEGELKPKVNLSADSIKNVMLQWKKIEADHAAAMEVAKEKEKNDEEENDLTAFDKISKMLAVIYDKELKWFVLNFDAATLMEVLTYISETLGNVKKSETT